MIRASTTTRPAALALMGVLALGAAACGDDVVDDGVEQEVDDAGDDAADTAEDLGDAASEGLEDEDGGY